MRRRFVMAVACLALAGVLVPVASADPIHAKNATQIDAICGGQSLTVVVNGNGEFTPAHVVSTTFPILLRLWTNRCASAT